MMGGMEDRLLTPIEAAELLGSKEKTLRNWRYEGYGPPFIKLRHGVRYRLRALEAWLEQREQARR